ncbi:protein kinase [Actinomadura barringtoniae]|uniref:Protein kinase n=1 Tax=Actinomadura barringtoniae TaxID=1427535 RepID=A0A939TG13_9ACTN|nr:protein kinase [Actinomadura barringtoniae]MBO2454960.1 protein kinase [Actinomadura barringtoniae]
MPETPHLDMPARIGPYQVMRRLGEGGMGTVYLGLGDDGRKVAIKVIRREYAADAQYRARFEAEVNAAQRVRPFCTAPVLDADPKADPPYLVTEFVSGASLDAAVRRDGRLSGADLEALAVGMASALTAIHDAGVVHRDLKPANVLLSPYGPRVIDFGIARHTDATRLTATGGIIGTPAFMSPEQLTGTPATAASDVFAWGATVAFAARGATCFTGDSIPAMIHQIMSAEPDLSGLDGVVLQVVREALSKDPKDRPTAQQVLERLVSSSKSASSRPAPQQTLPPTPQPTPPPTPQPVQQNQPAPAQPNQSILPPPAMSTDDAAALVERQYRQAAEAGDTAAMYNLGVLLSWRGQTAEADYWYQRARGSQPGFAQGGYNQGAYTQPSYGQQAAFAQPAYTQQGYTAQAPAQPGYSHAAIYAVSFGAVGLLTCGISSIPAIVAGHIAWYKISRNKQRGLGLAITGIALGWVMVAFWLLVAFGWSLPDEDPPVGG